MTDAEEAKRWNDTPRTVQLGSTLREHDGHLALFEHFPIRRTWHNGEWWYSIVDCMAPLAGTANPRRYWSDMKKRMLKDEQVMVYDLGVHQMKMPDPRGHMQSTDCANAEILLRIIQSIRSPNAEPFKIWLARVGAMVMDVGEERPLRQQYRAQLDQSDRDLHELVEYHGIVTEDEHVHLTDANYAGLYDVTCEMDLLRRRRMLPGMLPDAMGSLELAANFFQRELAADMIRNRDAQGVEAVTETAKAAGKAVRGAIEQGGGTLPENMPQYPPLPPGEWMPPDHPRRIQWDEPVDEGENQPIPIIEIRKPE